MTLRWFAGLGLLDPSWTKNEMSDPIVYQNHEALMEKNTTMDSLKKKLKELNDHWEDIAGTLDSLENE